LGCPIWSSSPATKLTECAGVAFWELELENQSKNADYLAVAVTFNNKQSFVESHELYQPS
jgi:hypothetical protein